jgi:hypothetical protein
MAAGALTEVTDIFTTALSGHAGERAISAFSDSTQIAFLVGKGPAPWRVRTFAEARSTVRESKTGVEPAFPERSIRHLHHQRWFEPRTATSLTWSLPGLTRQSTRSGSSCCVMDARVKPAHDEQDGLRSSRQTELWNWMIAALARRACGLLEARSAIGVRLSPRSLRQAPRAWARAFPREPRDPGLPFRHRAGRSG